MKKHNSRFQKKTGLVAEAGNTNIEVGTQNQYIANGRLRKSGQDGAGMRGHLIFTMTSL
jgi:hypothetical protein